MGHLTWADVFGIGTIGCLVVSVLFLVVVAYFAKGFLKGFNRAITRVEDEDKAATEIRQTLGAHVARPRPRGWDRGRL